MCSNHDHLKDINFPDFDKNLIGTDNIDFVTSQATITRTENAPHAISTSLVWKIFGPTADLLGISVFEPTFLTTTTKLLIGTDNIDRQQKGPQNAHVRFPHLLVRQLVVQQSTHLRIQFSEPALLTTTTQTKTHTFRNYYLQPGEWKLTERLWRLLSPKTKNTPLRPFGRLSSTRTEGIKLEFSGNRTRAFPKNFLLPLNNSRR